EKSQKFLKEFEGSFEEGRKRLQAILEETSGSISDQKDESTRETVIRLQKEMKALEFLFEEWTRNLTRSSETYDQFIDSKTNIQDHILKTTVVFKDHADDVERLLTAMK